MTIERRSGAFPAKYTKYYHRNLAVLRRYADAENLCMRFVQKNCVDGRLIFDPDKVFVNIYYRKLQSRVPRFFIDYVLSHRINKLKEALPLFRAYIQTEEQLEELILNESLRYLFFVYSRNNKLDLSFARVSNEDVGAEPDRTAFDLKNNLTENFRDTFWQRYRSFNSTTMNFVEPMSVYYFYRPFMPNECQYELKSTIIDTALEVAEQMQFEHVHIFKNAASGFHSHSNLEKFNCYFWNMSPPISAILKDIDEDNRSEEKFHKRHLFIIEHNIPQYQWRAWYESLKQISRHVTIFLIAKINDGEIYRDIDYFVVPTFKVETKIKLPAMARPIFNYCNQDFDSVQRAICNKEIDTPIIMQAAHEVERILFRPLQ